jgi:peptidoglycan/xylan/chitin deacetylase (PgdA/CDA1 family)
MNLLIKTSLAEGLDRMGLLAALRYFRSQRGIVLTFHRVLDKAGEAGCYDPHMMMSADIFDQLLSLLRNEFDVVGLEQLMEYPEAVEHRQRVAITFDDGWEDTYSVAFPLLQKYRMPATVFVCTDLLDHAESSAMLPEERLARIWNFCAEQDSLPPLIEDLHKWGLARPKHSTRVEYSQQLKKLPMQARLLLLAHLERVFELPPSGRRQMMTWEEAQIMARNDITLGSHTVRHCTLTSEIEDVILEELTVSREVIRERTGVQANLLAYPNGAYSSRVAHLARGVGYTHAVTTEMGFISRRTDPWAAPRLSMENLAVTGRSAKLSESRTRLYLQALTRRSLSWKPIRTSLSPTSHLL